MLRLPSTKSTFSLLSGLWCHLTFQRRMQVGLLLLVMLASGAAELLSLGAVLPFMAFLSDPQQLWHQPFVHQLADRLGFTNANQLLLPTTLVFGAAVLLAALIRLMNLWLNSQLAAALGSDLSCEAYRRTLCQPYGIHLKRNSATVITSTTTQISRTVSAITCLMQFITGAVVSAALLAGLLLIDWNVAIAAFVIFGGLYLWLAKTTATELVLNSRKIASTAEKQIMAIKESLGAIRDILLESSHQTYLYSYRVSDRMQRQLQARNEFLASYPRYAVEALGLISIALLGGLSVWKRGENGSVLPLLGALALGAQRLLPSLQQAYNSWSNLKAFDADMEGVLAMLNQSMPPLVTGNDPINFLDKICMKSVCFRYETDQPYILNNLHIEIRKGEHVGLIGRTGSGKSTIIDLIMGLLVPSSGCLQVDGFDLHDSRYPARLASWQATIAHVPQSIYLADSTLAQNIAFGVPIDKIDISRLKKAAESSNISDFIESCPQGYNTCIGENGISLSGGQRQRIGLARALYRNAQVLIFDEATSALDVATEDAVMSTIESLTGTSTIITIAHRLTTLSRCDRIIRIESGRVISEGTPDQILR